MRRLLKTLVVLLLALFALTGLCIGVYIGVAGASMLWPAHAEQRASRISQPSDIEAFVMTNGVHTDLVFPIRSAVIDWAGIFPSTDAVAAPRDAEFVAIGWGDREFYLHTPTWADLTLARALRAISGRNSSLLHVTWLKRGQFAMPESEGVYALPLTAAQYARLTAHVRAKLPDGRAVPLPGTGYGRQDAFYEATGSYGPLETCNTWTGRGLRNAGLTMGRWTPFDYNVVRHLDAVGR